MVDKKTLLKRVFAIALLSFPLVAMAAAGDNFAELEQSGDAAKGAIQGVLKHVIWLTALFPVGLGVFSGMRMKEHIENKEEQSQHEPKWMKNGKIVAAFAGGILIAFILIGVFGKIFMGLTFSVAWGKFVINFWKDVLI